MGMANKKFDSVLVTGGAGFIGCNLTESLLPISNKVIVVDDLSSGKKQNLPDMSKHENLEFIQSSIVDNDNLEEIFKKNKIEIIFHQAALINILRSFKEPILTNLVNVEGTIQLLKLAHKNKTKVNC